jgi:hypothetical protein
MSEREQEFDSIEIKRPSKILHFSDGVLEVFDDDDTEEDKDIEQLEEIVDVVS